MATSEELRLESERVEAQARQMFQDMKTRLESLATEVRTLLDAFVLYEENYTKEQERKEQERRGQHPDTKPRK
jgi:hypothetical protein